MLTENNTKFMYLVPCDDTVSSTGMSVSLDSVDTFITRHLGDYMPWAVSVIGDRQPLTQGPGLALLNSMGLESQIQQEILD